MAGMSRANSDIRLPRQRVTLSPPTRHIFLPRIGWSAAIALVAAFIGVLLANL
jgi:hypothetical protein